MIQAPLTAQTHHPFDESQLRRMKPTSILINTARGPIVDDRALHQALSEGWIAGAGSRRHRGGAAEEMGRVLTGQPPLSPVGAGALVEARWSRSS